MGRKRTQLEPPPRQVGMFLDMLLAERGAAANTLEGYARDLADFAAFAKARGHADLDAPGVDAAVIRG